MSRNAADATPNATLVNLRTSAGLAQHEVADRINALASQNGRKGVGVTANTVSRWERGIATPAPIYRRLIAELFGVPVDDLGLALRRDYALHQDRPRTGYVHDEDLALDPRVKHSQDEWRRTRRALNTRRAVLTQLATQVYDPAIRLEATGLLTHPSWNPEVPVDLSAIELDYQPDAPAPQIEGTESETSHVRPRASLVRRYQRYTQAIRDLDHPRLFENRASWRLTDLAWTQNQGRMSFGPTTYFAAIDTYEAAAHEMAYVHLTEHGKVNGAQPVMRDLPFRRLIGDPFDFARRPVMPSIDTLTIRRDRVRASFVLHRRDPRSVAVAGGMLQVIPSGVFQPSSVLPAALEADFDLWRNIMREYSEELLGNPEHDGDGKPVRYDEEPFRTINQARHDGRVRALCLGVAVDALTLVGEILTVLVFDADVFDGLAGEFVEVNDEGSIVTDWVPFTAQGVHDILTSGRIAPAGAGCIHLAWKHRDLILTP